MTIMKKFAVCLPFKVTNQKFSYKLNFDETHAAQFETNKNKIAQFAIFPLFMEDKCS